MPECRMTLKIPGITDLTDRMDMAFTLQSAAALLNQHHLLREVIEDGTWTIDPTKLRDRSFSDLSYDTRTVTPDTLLFCKGRFSPNT